MPAPLRVLIVSGIWPPDVGGPASHGFELGRFLARQGHEVTAIASVSETPVDPGFPLVTTSRDTALAIRWADAEAKIARLARSTDVIYATGLYHRSALASVATRVPLVVKIVNDPAYERARNSGLFDGTLEEFQTADGTRVVRVLKRLRNAMLARPRAIVVPSRYLARIIEGWNIAQARVSVIPNPAPDELPATPRDVLRRELGMEGPSVVFAGRFVLQKNLPMLVAAMRHVPGATLWLVGDGPERGRIAAEIDRRELHDRVRLRPAVPRDAVLRWMKAADVTALPSSWENFPHAAVESLRVGTPVVATAVGGVPEIVEQSTSGLLVARDDEEGFAKALDEALHEPGLNATLRDGARAAADRFEASRLFAAAEGVLVEQAARRTST